MGQTGRIATICLIALTTILSRTGVASGPAGGGNPRLTDVLNSLLYGDQAVREAFLALPFTAHNLTNNGVGLDCNGDNPTEALLCQRQRALYRVWQDPFSIKLLAYKWKNAHQPSDDLTFDPCLAAGNGGLCPVTFVGELGVCDRGVPFSPRGGAVDMPYGEDAQCQRWDNSLFAAQQNNFGYHSLIGFNGPTSKANQPGSPGWDGFVGNQLTSLKQVVPPSLFVKDSALPVDAVARTCDATTGTSGAVSCGQSPGAIGRCPAGETTNLRLKPGSNPDGVPIYLSVNQGSHAHNNPFAPGGMCAADPTAPCPDADFLGGTTVSSASPEVVFRCPLGPPSSKLGTFGSQWAKWDRLDTRAVAPDFELLVRNASGAFAPYVLPSGRPAWPANESDVFDRENREAVFMVNGSTPSADFLKCETRVGPTAALCSAPVCSDPLGCVEPPTRVCDPAFPACCSLCSRTAKDFSSQTTQADFIAGVGGPIDVGQPILNTAYVLFHNDAPESISVSNLLVSMNVWVPNAAAVITGSKIGTFEQVPGSPTIQVRVPDRSDVRRTVVLPRTSLLCGDNPLTPCRFQIPIDPPLTVEPDGVVFIGFITPGTGASEVEAWGDLSLSNTLATAAGADYWTGIYSIDGNAAGETWMPNIAFDPGANGLTTSGRMRLVVAGTSASNPLVMFPDAHMWLDSQWGDPSSYAANRLCTADGATCFARFEGSMNGGHAACVDDSISVDTNPLVSPPQALRDAGRCSLQNFTNNFSPPTPYVFDDPGDRYAHYAYGVTTFFPNYRDKPDGVVPLDCSANTAPIAPVLPALWVCAGDYVTLSAARTLDLDGDELVYAWTEQQDTVSPLAGPQPTFRAPWQQTMLTFDMTATDRCRLVGHSVQTVNVRLGNDAPHAIVASQAPVPEGTQVTLDASGSTDVETDPLSFAWTQTGGPAVQLSEATTPRPSFTAPALSGQNGVTLTFRVTVTDHPSRGCGVSETATDDVSVLVFNPNHAPTADAGVAQTVNELSTVTLDGTHSADTDNDSLTWQWTQVAGTPVALVAATTATPTFIAPHQPPTGQETLTFQLVVTDTHGAASPPATVNVMVRDLYTAPDCSAALPSVATLWPANRRMQTVRINNVTKRDPEVTLTLSVTEIWQDEPATGRGRNTPVDAAISNGSAQVRAERLGGGDGRVYHLLFNASDGYGGSCSGEVKVCVPTSPNKACGDGGSLYNSTR